MSEQIYTNQIGIESDRPESTAEITFDISSFLDVESECRSRKNSESGVISIVNTPDNGKRISLSKELMNKLEISNSAQIRMSDDCLLIAKQIKGSKKSFVVRKNGNKGAIYAADLIQEISKKFKLDYSTRTTITFPKVEYHSYDNGLIALIKIVDKDETEHCSSEDSQSEEME